MSVNVQYVCFWDIFSLVSHAVQSECVIILKCADLRCMCVCAKVSRGADRQFIFVDLGAS